MDESFVRKVKEQRQTKNNFGGENKVAFGCLIVDF